MHLFWYYNIDCIFIIQKNIQEAKMSGEEWIEFKERMGEAGFQVLKK